jgi:ubiquinone/menaquinone biosynthesis C-methylase UbiE
MFEPALFDSMAAEYDHSFTDSLIGQMQRERVYHFLLPMISGKEKLRILELNCGTGTDALFLARLGHEVVATDASPEMLEQATTKAVHNNLQQNLSFQVCRFEEVSTKFSGQKFDLVFSNFGGLNCINRTEVQQLAQDLELLIQPGGQCILVVMGTDCRWEQLYFLWKGKFKKAFRRLHQKESIIQYKGHKAAVYYFSPKTLAASFSPAWKPLSKRPVGLFIPPSYLTFSLGKQKTFLRFLGTAEKIFGGLSLFSNLSDHYLIQLKVENKSTNI